MVRKPYATWIFKRRWNRGGTRAVSPYDRGTRAANRDPDYVFGPGGRKYRYRGQQGRRIGSPWYSTFSDGMSADAAGMRFSIPGSSTKRVHRSRRMRVSQPWWERLMH